MTKLYYHLFAPNSVKILVYLGEKGIELEKVEVKFSQSEQESNEHLARNPLGTLPVLQLDSGQHLIESLPIMEYLEECFPEPPMLGISPEETALVRSAERIIEHRVLIPISRIIHNTLSPFGYPPNPVIAESEYLKLPAGLEYMDNFIRSNEFVMGERATIADCTLYAALNFANFGKLEIGTHYINIHRWFKNFMLRDSTRLI